MDTTEEPREQRFTREELYELVWTQPLLTLASRFGISDVALKKRCLRMRIPTPGRGYWAMKEAGNAPKRPRLPPLPDSVPAAVRTAVFGCTPKAPAVPEVERTGPVADQERFEEMEANQIVVPALLGDPHPLVASSIHLLRRARTNAEHLLVPSGKKCLDLAVSLGTADRAMLIFDTLIKALEARAFPVRLAPPTEHSETAYRTVVTVHDEQIGIAITESVERTERPPNPKAKYPVYGKEWEYHPTGRLSLRILVPYLSTRVRGTWSDGSKQRVETLLNDFIVGLVAVAQAVKDHRVAQAEREREWQAERQRHEEAEKRRQEEAARVRALSADMKRWRRSVIIREYADALRHAAEAASLLTEDSDLAWWLEWVEDYANRVDPMLPTPKVPGDPNPYHWYGAGSSNEPEVLW